MANTWQGTFSTTWAPLSSLWRNRSWKFLCLALPEGDQEVRRPGDQEIRRSDGLGARGRQMRFQPLGRLSRGRMSWPSCSWRGRRRGRHPPSPGQNQCILCLLSARISASWYSSSSVPVFQCSSAIASDLSAISLCTEPEHQVLVFLLGKILLPDVPTILFLDVVNSFGLVVFNNPVSRCS